MPILAVGASRAPTARNGHFIRSAELPVGHPLDLRSFILFLIPQYDVSPIYHLCTVNTLSTLPTTLSHPLILLTMPLKGSASTVKPKSSAKSKKASIDDVEQVVEVVSSGKLSEIKVYWNKDPSRTDRLLDWLNENPSDHQKLFSDSAQDAKDEGHTQRKAKGAKSSFHLKMAESIFSVDKDPKIRKDFAANPTKYAKSVENRIGT